jgi:hypothetical protein
VDAACGQPSGEAAQAHAEHVGDSLFAAEGGDLAERPEAVRPERSPLLDGDEVGGESARLAQGVLAGGRIYLARGGGVGNRGAVPESPDVVVTLDLEGRADADPAPLIDR